MHSSFIDQTSIQAHGFHSWSDFYFSIQRRSFENRLTTYIYETSDHKAGIILLELPVPILEGLVLEEGRLLLKMLKINSFADLVAKIEGGQVRYGTVFHADIIRKNRKDEFSYQRIQIQIDHIYQLHMLEVKERDYVLYEEPVVWEA